MRLETEGRQILHETAVVYGWSEDIGIHALASAVNSLVAAGAKSAGAGIRIAYPPRADKSGIYRMEKRIRKVCKERGIKVLESRIFEHPLLSVPSVTVNGIAEAYSGGKGHAEKTGTGRSGSERLKGRIPAGTEIVLSKWIGMDGMLQIVRERRDELSERFTPAFIRQMLSYEKELFAGRETEVAQEHGVLASRQITEGGIFAALWEFAGEFETGLDLDLKKFSILQETVEVCEHFRLNPYQLTSAGSFLFVAEDGKALREAFLREGIKASVIGRTAEGQAKIIRNGEDVRFIDRPAPDEIWKLNRSGDKR